MAQQHINHVCLLTGYVTDVHLVLIGALQIQNHITTNLFMQMQKNTPPYTNHTVLLKLFYDGRLWEQRLLLG